MQKFLDCAGQFARTETYKPTASYAPGVTGFGIRMEYREQLTNPECWIKHPEYRELSSILSSCLAFNLLDAFPDHKQGRKDERWLIFNLNRWLCVRYGLPLHYGGWRPKTLGELTKWIGGGSTVLVQDRGGLS